MKKNKETSISNYVMLFMVDGSIRKVPPKNLPDYRIIEYLLIPLEGFNSTAYICVESNPYINFEECKIKSDIKIEFFSDGVPSKTLNLENNETVIHTINELYNYLHSLIRYDRITAFTESYYDDTMPSDIYISFSSFEIELYYEGEMIYYKKKKNKKRFYNITDLLDNELSDLFPPMYEYFKMSKSRDNVFVIKNNRWKIKDYYKIGGQLLIGIFSPYLKIVNFIDRMALNVLSVAVKSFTMSYYLIDENKYAHMGLDKLNSSDLQDMLNLECNPIRSEFLWINDMEAIIEVFDMVQIYTKLFITIVDSYYKTFYPEMASKMEYTMYWIFSMDFNSTKHASEIFSISSKEAPTTLSDFVNGIQQIINDKQI